MLSALALDGQIHTIAVAHASGIGEENSDAEGFIQCWLILIFPCAGDKVAVGDTQLARHAWTRSNLYHFAYALNKATSFGMFWAVTVVLCPDEGRDVRLSTGLNAASIWWGNNQEVFGIYGERQTVSDDGVSKGLILRK